MLTKLPRWVETGAFLLAILAGSVNAVGLLGFQHQAVSHLSGTATLLGVAIFTVDKTFFHLLAILLCFLLGAVISGLLIENTALKLGRHYSFALLIEGVFLMLAMAALNRGWDMGHYLASAACGIQNALVTTYSGAIIRTTHVTGIFTDLGLMLGGRLRGKQFDHRKAVIYLLIISGFILGGSVGAAAFNHWRFYALLMPACLSLLLAVIYWIYRHNQSHHYRQSRL